MTVPPNYGVPPEHPPTPGYGYGAQQPYGGALPPEEPRRRNLGLVGGIVIGCTTLLLGAILLIVLGVNRGGEDPRGPQAGAESSSAEQSPTEEADQSTTEAADEVVGSCLPYEPQVAGGDVEFLDSCDEAEAFWTVTAWSDEVDATVGDDGKLTDNQPGYDVCGEVYGEFPLGEAWTDWYYVYDQETGAVDFLYCIEAIGTADEAGRTPYMPDTGACFDDSDEWWTVPCDAPEAVYEVVDTVEFDQPREMSDDEVAEEATCGGDLYWNVTDLEGRTTAILCGNEL